MKLYADPISTTSRAVLLYLAEHEGAVEPVTVSLMEGAHQAPAYAALNPNKAVPTLADEDFVLTECSAILKYLAERQGSPAYPADIRARARVNQAMDWLNTGFYKDFGYGYVYAQTLPHHRHANPSTQKDVVDRGLERAKTWLGVLNDHWLGSSPYLCGQDVTLADYMGAAYVSAGDWVGFDLSPWPNVATWMERMRARPSWAATHGHWDGLCAYMRSSVLEPA